MSTKTERLTRAVRWLQAYAALMTIPLVVLLVRSDTATDGVLRARGLIIEDDAGRERILIGAPIPQAANRFRTDEARVREVWGPRFSEEYMSWYQDYNHSTKSSNVEQAVPHPLDPSASLMTIPVLGPMRLADVRIGLWVAEGNPVEAVLAQDEDTVGAVIRCPALAGDLPSAPVP